MNVTPSTLLTATRSVAPTRRLAGWLPAGMLDWPGRVTTTLFLSGCQMRCPYCHNPSLIVPSDEHAETLWHDVLSYLETRRSWVDGFVITGGEPTDDPDLLTLLERLKAAEMPVKLDTNGLRPDVLGVVVRRKLASYVALDVKARPEDYDRLTSTPRASELVQQSIDLITSSGIDHEFRTTCYPGIVDPAALETIARSLEGGRLYALQQFRPDSTLAVEARGQQPFGPMELLDAARTCSRFIPTITRGV